MNKSTSITPNIPSTTITCLPSQSRMSQQTQALTVAAKGAAGLEPLMQDLLEDPISGEKIFKPVLLADGRIYDQKTVDKLRKKSPDGVLRSPFTRQVMPAPQPMPQLQAIAEVLYADEIAAATLLRRQLAGLKPPPMPKLRAFALGALSAGEADSIVAQQRRTRDGTFDLARIDAALLFNAGLLRRGKDAEIVIRFLTDAGCLDPETQHLDAATDAYRLEQALSQRTGPWYKSASRIPQQDRDKLISAFRLIAGEEARLAPLKQAYQRAKTLLARAEKMQLTSAIAPLNKRIGEIFRELLKKPSEVVLAARV